MAKKVSSDQGTTETVDTEIVDAGAGQPTDGSPQEADHFANITSDPTYCGGRPFVKGTRMTVDRIVMMVESGRSKESICKLFPDCTPSMIDEAMAFHACGLNEKKPLVEVPGEKPAAAHVESAFSRIRRETATRKAATNARSAGSPSKLQPGDSFRPVGDKSDGTGPAVDPSGSTASESAAATTMGDVQLPPDSKIE